MQLAAIALAAAVLAAGQESVQTYTYDVNGNRVAGPAVTKAQSDGVTEITERGESINGRSVPLEKIVERVLRDDAQGKITERVIVRYDRNGQPGPPEIVRVEESKTPDGGSVARTTVLRRDMNGNASVVERSVARTEPAGSGTATEITIERPTLNGAFETAERRTINVQKTDGVETEYTTVYRPDENGRMYEALKRTREKREQDGSIAETSAVYERGAGGAMELSEQTVRRVEKDAAGSESTQVDIFRRAAPGLARVAGSRLALIERQRIDRRPSDGGYIKTVSVERPSLADPSRLGEPQKIAETVCRGKCDDK